MVNFATPSPFVIRHSTFEIRHFSLQIQRAFPREHGLTADAHVDNLAVRRRRSRCARRSGVPSPRPAGSASARPFRASRRGAARGSSRAGRWRSPSPRLPRCRGRARTCGCTPSLCRRRARARTGTRHAPRSRPVAQRGEPPRSSTALSTARRVARGTNRNGTPHDTTWTGNPVAVTAAAGSPSAAAARARIRDDVAERWARAASSTRS